MSIVRYIVLPDRLVILGMIALLSTSLSSAQLNDSTRSDSLEEHNSVLKGERISGLQMRILSYMSDWRSISEGFVLATSLCRRATSFADSSGQLLGGMAEYGLHIVIPAATTEMDDLALLPYAEAGAEARIGGLYGGSTLGAMVGLSFYGILVQPFLHPAIGYSMRIGRRLSVQIEAGTYILIPFGSLRSEGMLVYAGLNLMQQ